MVKLSIIIPIYKVEEYIIECIESICCQLVDGVEVILVNDGTPDRSMEMARSYLESNYGQYSTQFIFLDQENQGQSIARNVALKKASGEYIAFLDSDDVLRNIYVASFFEVVSKKRPDIIRFGVDRFTYNQNDYSEFISFHGVSGLNKNIDQKIEDIFKQGAWFPWMNIYKSNLFLNEEFPSGLYFEDAWLIPIIIEKAKDIVFLDSNLYLYRNNLNSSLNNKSEANLHKLDNSYVEIIETYHERLQASFLYSRSYVSFLMSYINFLLSIRSYSKVIKISRMRKYKYVKSDQLERSSKLFYYFGVFFIVFYKLVGRI